jgi:hypothetical protein
MRAHPLSRPSQRQIAEVGVVLGGEEDGTVISTANGELNAVLE